jgi:hypothetical protein
MKFADETKGEFTHRIMRSRGFGSVERVAPPRQAIVERTRDEISKDQEAHQERYFGSQYQLGSAAKWGWQP